MKPNPRIAEHLMAELVGQVNRTAMEAAGSGAR